jgi:hypothetical protein
LISGAKSGANFSFKACCNLVKRVEVVILLPLIEDPKNIKLAYSTSFGNTASDNAALPNSLYTSILSTMLNVDGLTITNILDNTAKFVLIDTKEKQIPTHYFGVHVTNIQLKNK